MIPQLSYEINPVCPACGCDGIKHIVFKQATPAVPGRRKSWFRRARPAVESKPQRLVCTCKRCNCEWSEIPLCDRKPEELPDTADIEDRLEAELEREAVCHCGEWCKNHTQSDNHTACWHPDPYTRVVYDARRTIDMLRTKLQVCMEELLARRVGNPYSKEEKATDEIVALPDTPKD